MRRWAKRLPSPRTTQGFSRRTIIGRTASGSIARGSLIANGREAQ
jgi:hypothetical protein